MKDITINICDICSSDVVSNYFEERFNIEKLKKKI